MRTINLADVTAKIKEMFIDACENIPQNVLDTIKEAEKQEESPRCQLPVRCRSPPFRRPDACFRS